MVDPQPDCLDDETIAQLLARSLDPAAADRVEAHLDRCVECRRHVSDLVRQAPAERRTLGGRYIVLASIGRGGMGEVFEAYDPELGRRVAIKLLRLGRGHGPDAGTRLRREAQAMARLAHPNVVAVYDLGLDGDQVFVAMERVDGTTLSAWAKGAAPAACLAACVDAGRGLAAAHAVGLVHRDVTPRNILVGTDGRARVTDFGLVRITGQDDVTPGPASGSPAPVALDELTRTGEFVGTPLYAAPEVFDGASADERSDQWSWAATTWHVLTGEPPFAGRTFLELGDAITHGRIAEPARRLPPRVRRALVRALAVDPARRHPSLAAALAEVAPRRTTRWWIAGGAIAAIAGVLAVAVPRDDARTCVARDPGDAWNPTRAAALVQAFARLDTPFARDQAGRVVAAFDAHARRWSAQSLVACEAAPAPELEALRAACLDEKLAALVALRDRLTEHLDPAAVEGAAVAALALPAADACADTAALVRRAPPADPAVAARIAAVRRRFADLDALDATAQYGTALLLARALVAEARAPELAAVLPEALYLLADAEDSAGDPVAARQALEEAGRLAAAAHDDTVVAKSWLSLLYLAGSQEQESAEAMALLPVVTAAVARAGEPAIDARYECIQAIVYEGAGELADAERHAAACVAQLEAAHGADHLDVAKARVTLAGLHHRRGDHAGGHALEARALATFEQLLGPEHPMVARTLANAGHHYADEGKYAEAEAALARALAIQTGAFAPGHPEIAWTHRDLGHLWLVRREYTKARGYYQEALTMFAQLPGHDGHVAGLVAKVAATLVEDGLCAEAIPQLQRALELGSRAFGADDPARLDPLTRLAECRAAVGEHAAAEAIARDALTMIAAIEDPIDVADYRFRIARALGARRAGRAEARELARAARVTYAADPAYAADLALVDGWLADH